jgi:hypothetical protein
VVQLVNNPLQAAHIPSFKAYPEEQTEQVGLLLASKTQVSQLLKTHVRHLVESPVETP